MPAETCQQCIQIEASNDLTTDHSHTRPADLVMMNWASLLNTLALMGMSAGYVALAAEKWKQVTNDAKCCELGWQCVPLVTVLYDAWGREAVEAFSQLAS